MARGLGARGPEVQEAYGPLTWDNDQRRKVPLLRNWNTAFGETGYGKRERATGGPHLSVCKQPKSEVAGSARLSLRFYVHNCRSRPYFPQHSEGPGGCASRN